MHRGIFGRLEQTRPQDDKCGFFPGLGFYVHTVYFNCVQKISIFPLSLAFQSSHYLFLQGRKDLFQIRRWEIWTWSETLQQRDSFFNSHHRFRHGIKERIIPFVSLTALYLQRSWDITVLDWQNVHYKEDPFIRYTGEWLGSRYCGMCRG